MSIVRIRDADPIRVALHQAMLSPSVQAAATAFIGALVEQSETILRQTYAGETVRVYAAKRGGRDERLARDRRIVALASPPSSLCAERIAQREGITPRRVRQILADAARKSSA